MKYKWLNNKNNDKLIIFFNGWGMDENAVKHLEPEDYNIVMFYDYNNLKTDFKLNKKYLETNIIAWSMGVMIAGVHKINYSGRFVAINGTLKPIDTKYGIHPKIYDLTIENFNENSRDKFIKNMFNNEDIPDSLNNRSIENVKSELIALKSYSADINYKPNKIIISNNDKIIPTKNQSAFWGIEPNLKGGHYPFFNFK